MSIITMTTDFGLRDWFVGTMKGVVLGLQPHATIVDITHEIPSGDIRAGAFALAASFSFFPKRTIHLAVVDPGVGGGRSPIAVQTEDYFFLGPDNGLLSLALEQQQVKAVHRLENQKYLSNSICHTFHGRDVFAPMAAHLSKRISLAQMGEKLADYKRVPWPSPKLKKGCLRGEVIYIDHFGNAITNIEEWHLSRFDRERLKISVPGNKKTFGLRRFYEEAGPRKTLGLIGSSGFLEIAVNGSSAARQLSLRVGDPVLIQSAGQSRG